MTSASSQKANTSGTGTSVSRNAARYRYSRDTSLADGRNAPTGGRRTTSSVSPTVTAIVRFDAPPLMISWVSEPSTPTWSRSQAPSATASRSDVVRTTRTYRSFRYGAAVPSRPGKAAIMRAAVEVMGEDGYEGASI